MTTEGKVSPLPVLALMPLPVRCIDYDDSRCIVGADGRWLAQVNRQVIEEFALRINAHDRLVEALEGLLAHPNPACADLDCCAASRAYSAATNEAKDVLAALAAAKEG